MTSAILATYPGRVRYVPQSVSSLLSQVDEVIVVGNQFRRVDLESVLPPEVRVIIPTEDLKDEGKFCQIFSPDQFVALCDDDIIYPHDYIETLKGAYIRYAAHNAVIGVHGILYSDFFDGKPDARVVHVFTESLDEDRFVNQVGTGTVLCRGFQLPSFDFMRGSARFVDLRFAVHCHRRKFPRICIKRREGWMIEQETESSIFQNFTQQWPEEVIREAQEIAGLRFLPSRGLVAASGGGD